MCFVFVLQDVCLLVAYRPSNMLVYLRDGSAQTVVRAATLRQKLQTKLSTSPSILSQCSSDPYYPNFLPLFP